MARITWFQKKYFLILLVGTLCSCSTYQDQVGSAHMAVISVAPWDSRKDEMSPKFPITSSDTLKLIAEHTSSISDFSSSSFSAGIGDAGGGSDSKPGTDPKKTGMSAEDISRLDIPGIAAMDPMSAYLSATALFQEIKLLNFSAEDAAKRDNYTPYIVRMQVTLMPFVRNAPYDVYMTAAFFPTAGVVMPQVVPLLVTDSMETAKHYLEDESSKQIMLSALGLLGNSKISGDLSKDWQNLQARAGRDRNSLLTVARLTDNSIRVRFGASRQVESEFAMIPQNHYVTILLLVPNSILCPENDKKIELVTESYFVDVKTGKTLESRKAEDVKAKIQAITERYSPYDESCTSDKWGELVQYVIAGDYGSFEAEISPCKFTKAIYTSLLSIQVGNRADSTSFDLPVSTPTMEMCVSTKTVVTAPSTPAPIIPFCTALSAKERSTDSSALHTRRSIVVPHTQKPIIAPNKSIYGKEEQLDYFEAPARMQTLADSVVSLWDSAKVTEANGKYKLATRPFGEALNLCPAEIFSEQPIGAFCSGALVSEDMVVTSGYCIKTDADCAKTRVIFGYKGVPDTRDGAVTAIAKNEVYGCAKIRRYAGRDPGAEYTLIKLDRKVAGHKPLPINRSGSMPERSQIFMIGYPAGLPIKITDTGVSGASQRDYFMADLDAFGGDSGSPVFNASTMKIEGVLVPEDVYVEKSPAGCALLGTYQQTEAHGAAVAKMSALSADIPKLPGE